MPFFTIIALLVCTTTVLGTLPQEPCTRGVRACRVGEPSSNFAQQPAVAPVPSAGALNPNGQRPAGELFTMDTINRQRAHAETVARQLVNTLSTHVKAARQQEKLIGLPNPQSVRENTIRITDQFERLKKYLTVTTRVPLNANTPHVMGSYPLLSFDTMLTVPLAQVVEIMNNLNPSKLRWALLMQPDTLIPYATELISTFGIITPEMRTVAERMLLAWLTELDKHSATLMSALSTQRLSSSPKELASYLAPLRAQIAPAHISASLAIVLFTLLSHNYLLETRQGKAITQGTEVQQLIYQILTPTPQHATMVQNLLTKIHTLLPKENIPSPSNRPLSQAVEKLVVIMLATFMPQQVLTDLSL